MPLTAEAAADPSTPPAGRRAYTALAVAVVVLMFATTTNHLWSNTDFWLWYGAVRELHRNGVRPLHPLLGIDAPDTYLNPYTVAVALLARATPLDPFGALVVAGLTNLVLVLGGLWSLGRRVTSTAAGPVLALVLTLVGWGWQPWRWSGFVHLNALGAVLPYGSTFAVGVGLFSMAWLCDWLAGRSLLRLAAVGGGVATVILSHPTTGVWVAILAAAMVLGHGAALGRRDRIALGATALAAAALVLLWPFFPALELSTRSGDYVNTALTTGVLQRTVLLVPGMLALGGRLRSSRRDPLGMAALAMTAVFVVGWATGSTAWSRVVPGVALCAHLALADWLGARLGQRTDGDRRPLIAALVAGLVFGVVGTAPGWVRAVPRELAPAGLAARLHSPIDRNRAFAEVLDPDDVVAAPPAISLPIGGGAARVVSVDGPLPFVPDLAMRRADTAGLLDPATPGERRRALVERYGVTVLVTDPGRADALSDAAGPVERIDDVAGWTVLRLRIPPSRR